MFLGITFSYSPSKSVMAGVDFLRDSDKTQIFIDIAEHRNTARCTLRQLESLAPHLSFHRLGRRIQINALDKSIVTTHNQLLAFQWAFNHGLFN